MTLMQAEEILQPHAVAMIEVQKKLAEGQRGKQGDVARNLLQLANQLRKPRKSHAFRALNDVQWLLACF